MTYDTFALYGWTTTRPTETAKAGGEVLLDGTLEDVADSLATRSITFTVTPVEYTGKNILSPHRPDSVDEPTTLRTLEPGGLFVGLERPPVDGPVHRDGRRADPRGRRS